MAKRHRRARKRNGIISASERQPEGFDVAKTKDHGHKSSKLGLGANDPLILIRESIKSFVVRASMERDLGNTFWNCEDIDVLPRCHQTLL